MKKILIVGGGIGGLTAMNYLIAQGHDVHLIEKQPDFHPVGAGIMLGINAMKLLGELGLAEQVINQGQSLQDFSIVDRKGRFVGMTDAKFMEAETGHKTVAIHRGVLQTILSSKLDITQCRFNTEIKQLDQNSNESVEVTYQDDSTDRFDLVIAADGIHSPTRKLLSLPSTLRYAGYTCWRFVVDAPKDLLAHDKGYEYWGKGRRFGIVPLGDNQVYCFATANSPQNIEENKTLSTADFKEKFVAFEGEVPKILNQLSDDDTLIHNDLCDQMAVRLQKDRVALLGDASHAATPNMGQGAAMAIEDAYVLSQCLTSESDIPKALQSYESRRVARVKLIRDRSHRVGSISQWESPFTSAIRNSMLRLTPKQSLSKDLCQLLMDY